LLLASQHSDQTNHVRSHRVLLPSSLRSDVRVQLVVRREGVVAFTFVLVLAHRRVLVDETHLVVHATHGLEDALLTTLVRVQITSTLEVRPSQISATSVGIDVQTLVGVGNSQHVHVPVEDGIGRHTVLKLGADHGIVDDGVRNPEFLQIRLEVRQSRVDVHPSVASLHRRPVFKVRVRCLALENRHVLHAAVAHVVDVHGFGFRFGFRKGHFLFLDRKSLEVCVGSSFHRGSRVHLSQK